MRLPTLVCTLAAVLPLVACASSDPTAEEDAAADAAPSGKSDASGFAPGWYRTFEVEYADNEPLTAIFHENGAVDMAIFLGEENYDTEYVMGTYKVYTYAGRDRLRITREDGSVVLRTDWSRLDDGKLSFSGKEWYQPRQLPEEEIDCLTMFVSDPTVLEEGLSVYEYPEVSLDKEVAGYALDLGAASFDATESTLKIADKPTEVVVTATLNDGGYGYGIRVSKTEPRRGEVFSFEDAAGPQQTFANIICR